MRPIHNFIRDYKDIIFSLVLLTATVASVFFGIIPVIQRIFELYNSVNETAKSVSILRQKRTMLDSLNESELVEELRTVTAAIPSDKSLATILQTVDVLSGETSVTLTDITLINPGSLATEAAKRQTSEEKSLGSSLLPFNVSVEAPISSLQAFLNRVTTIRRLLKLRNFNISFVESSTSASLRMALDAFYTPLPKLSPQIERPLPTMTTEEYSTIAKLAGYPWLTQTINVPFGITSTSGRQNPFAH